MKKIFLLLTITLFFSLFIPVFSADGFVHIYDQDMWRLSREEQQFCAINYQEGYQNMILAIQPGRLTGEKAVWIFPVPASPDKTTINILKGFPQLLGYDIQEKADESISEVFNAMRLTQIYTFPILIMKSMFVGNMKESSGVNVYESIEKMGLTTELVSAVDGSSLTNYINSKGLALTQDSKETLDEYIGQDYSFVISWISDVQEFLNERKEWHEYRLGMWTGGTIGVFVSFPTDKIYYPLKPTSVYQDKKVPAIIYVLDHVTPELYDKIKSDTEVNYFFQNELFIPESLKEFFTGYDLEPSRYYSEEGFDVKGVKYTKIKINSSSKDLTEDLWIKSSVPTKVRATNFVNKLGKFYGLVFFILCSCLASLFSGMIIFRNESVSKIKLTFLGLWNFLTLIGFSIATYASKFDSTPNQSQELEKSTSFIKIIGISLIISLLPTFLFYFLIVSPFGILYNGSTMIPFFIIYSIATILIIPFVWIHYRGKKYTNNKRSGFVILFTIFFILLTYISQKFLSWII